MFLGAVTSKQSTPFFFKEMFDFQKIWRVLFSCNTGFENHPFALLPKNYAKSSSSFERHGLINFIFYFNI